MVHSRLLALSKSCWTAFPSITHFSGAEGSQQHTAHIPCRVPLQPLCRNTSGQRCTAADPTPDLYNRPTPLLDPPLLQHGQGLKEVAPSAKGTPRWTRTTLPRNVLLPSCCDRLYGASPRPALKHEGPLLLWEQLKSAHCFFMGRTSQYRVVHQAASWHSLTAISPGHHGSPSQSINPVKAEGILKLASKQHVLRKYETDGYQSTAASQQSNTVCFAGERDGSPSPMSKEENDKFDLQSSFHQLCLYQLLKGASRTKLFKEW